VRRSFGRKETEPALFPGYIFVAVELQWRSARWAPGVRALIMDGERPAVVGDHIINEIRQREVDGLIELPKRPLRRGDPVRVTRGIFRDQLALYQGQAPHERIAILLTLLGSPRRIELPRDAIEAI
jgi:transcription antitermination factor NusG